MLDASNRQLADGSKLLHSQRSSTSADFRLVMANIAYTLISMLWSTIVLLVYTCILFIIRAIHGVWNLTVVQPTMIAWHSFLHLYEKLIIPIFYFSLLASLMGMIAGIFVGVYAVAIQSLIPSNTRQVEPERPFAPSSPDKPPRRRSDENIKWEITSRSITPTSSYTSISTTSPTWKRNSSSSNTSGSPLNLSRPRSFEAVSLEQSPMYEDEDGYACHIYPDPSFSVSSSRRTSRESLRGNGSLTINEAEGEIRWSGQLANNGNSNSSQKLASMTRSTRLDTRYSGRPLMERRTSIGSVFSDDYEIQVKESQTSFPKKKFKVH